MYNCGECHKKFSTQGALDQHLTSPRHVFECKECARLFGSQRALRQHMYSPVHSIKPSSLLTPVRQQEEPQKIQPSKRAHGFRRPDDSIDKFFAKYPRFPYDRNRFPRDEMLRMCRFFGWPSRKQREDLPERDVAWDDFRISLVLAFNSIFGTDVNDSSAWGKICKNLAITPIPETLEGRRQAAVCAHVNLMDLFSLTRASQPVHVFRTEEELRRYTIETGKFFPKEEAYAGGLLKYMLRQITGTYNGKRGMSKKTGGQGMDRGRGKN